MSNRPALTVVDGRPRPARSQDTRRAADGLDRLLAALEPAGTPRDRRVRLAIAAAADALRDGQDPLDAISATYG